MHKARLPRLCKLTDQATSAHDLELLRCPFYAQLLMTALSQTTVTADNAVAIGRCLQSPPALHSFAIESSITLARRSFKTPFFMLGSAIIATRT
jgi:hypothetical protein